MKVKKHVYRPGDRVEIINPKWIKRIGYPLIWTDLIDEVINDPRSEAAWYALKGYSPDFSSKRIENHTLGISKATNLPFEFIRAVAMERVRERSFGGNERAIIYETDKELTKFFPFPCDITDTNCPMHQYWYKPEVVSKRIAKTGTRVPARSYDNYYGEYDYEPGYLANEKTHVILKLSTGFEIEECNVKPV